MVLALPPPDLAQLGRVVAGYCERPSESCDEAELTDLVIVFLEHVTIHAAAG